MVSGLKKWFDDTVGPPGEALKAVRDISTALTTVDEAKLRLLKTLIDSVGRVRGSPEELQLFLEVMRLVSSCTMEQLEAVRDITANLVKLVRYLPKGGLDALPIKDIMREMKK